MKQMIVFVLIVVQLFAMPPAAPTAGGTEDIWSAGVTGSFFWGGMSMFQAYRSEKCFYDKEWLPFTGDTEGDCRKAVALDSQIDVTKVYIAQVDSMLTGLKPVPKNAKFVGKF